MGPMEEQVQKMEKQLRQWGASLDALMAKAEETGEEVKVEYRKQLRDLKSKHQDAQAKLKELQAAGSDKWDGFKSGVESAWAELEIAFKGLTK